MIYRDSVVCFSLILVFPPEPAAVAAPPKSNASQIEFFERKVRPLLAERCDKCHSGKSKPLKGGFRLDSREALLKGGDSGTAIVPGKPHGSLLIRAVRYQANEMPPNGKLKPPQIATLVKWVQMGAPWSEGTANVASQPGSTRLR